MWTNYWNAHAIEWIFCAVFWVTLVLPITVHELINRKKRARKPCDR